MDFMMANQMQMHQDMMMQQQLQQNLMQQQQMFDQQIQQHNMQHQLMTDQAIFQQQQLQQQQMMCDFLDYYHYMTHVSKNPFKETMEAVTEASGFSKAMVKAGQKILGPKGLGNPAYVSFKSKAIYTLAVQDGNKYLKAANAALKKGNKKEALINLKAARERFKKAIKSVRDGTNSHTVYEKVYGDMIMGGLMSYLVDTFRTFRAAKELKEYGSFGESWGKELKKQGILKIINALTLGFSGVHVYKKRKKFNIDANNAERKLDKTKLNQFKNDTLYLLRVYLNVIEEMIANIENKPLKESYDKDYIESTISYLMESISEPVIESLDVNTKKKTGCLR